MDDALVTCVRLLNGFGLPWLEELPREEMPPPVGDPTLLALLRRRRDLPTKARRALAQVLARRVAQLEPQLREVAERGRYHARLVAQQILERRAGRGS